MEHFTCGDCENFQQHYIKRRDSFQKIIFGHCIYPRLKRRDAKSPACEHFQLRNPKD